MVSVRRLPSGSLPPLPLEANLPSFVKRLRVAGYAERTIRKRKSVAASFVRWLSREELGHNDLDTKGAAFLRRLRRPSKHRLSLERAAVRLFILHLRAE